MKYKIEKFISHVMQIKEEKIKRIKKNKNFK